MKKAKSIFVAASIVLALAFTTSCSGDGGGNDDTPSSSSLGGASTPSSSSESEQNGIVYGTLHYGGKSYKTVQIGDQTWMAENLNYDGGDGSLGICYDDNESNCEIYGRLYYWTMAMDFDPECYYDKCETQAKHRGICPDGWHIPSDAEWNKLYELAEVGECEDYGDWGRCPKAGAKLKAKSGWNEDGNGTDDFGFSALPGGSGFEGDFSLAGYIGYWWSSSEYEIGNYNVYIRDISYYNEYADWDNSNKTYLYSVRCVKD